MLFFKRKPEQTDALATRKGVEQTLERLRDKRYFIRPEKIRRPILGDKVTYWVGGGWSINTSYRQTATVENDPTTGKFLDDYGNVYLVKRNKNGGIIAMGYHSPLHVLKVSKPRPKTSK